MVVLFGALCLALNRTHFVCPHNQKLIRQNISSIKYLFQLQPVVKVTVRLENQHWTFLPHVDWLHVLFITLGQAELSPSFQHQRVCISFPMCVSCWCSHEAQGTTIPASLRETAAVISSFFFGPLAYLQQPQYILRIFTNDGSQIFSSFLKINFPTPLMPPNYFHCEKRNALLATIRWKPNLVPVRHY